MANYPIPNTPQLSDINAFRAMISKHNGLAKSCRFCVQIPVLQSQDFTMLCETAELPGRALLTGEYRYYGPTFQMPYQSTYQPILFQFICRDKFTERQRFDIWMNAINPRNTYDFNYRDSYCTPIYIWQLSEVAGSGGEIIGTYKFELRNAYPINVQPQQVNWQEDGYHRLNVQFVYTDWILPTETNAPKFKLIEGANILTNTSITPGGFIP